MPVENRTVNVNKAVKEFIVAFAYPELKPEAVLLGNVNTSLMPPASNDFIVFYHLFNNRVGTGVENWDKADADALYLSETVRGSYQIDCYAPSKSGANPNVAMLRAQTLETIGRSHTGAEFLRKRGVGLIEVSNAKNMTAIGDSGLNLYRWQVQLEVSFKSNLVLPQDYFTKADVGLHNADVRFPPKGD